MIALALLAIAAAAQAAAGPTAPTLAQAAAGPAAPQAPPNPAPQDEIVLRVMTHERWFAGWEYMEAATKEFEAEHPGVRVELISSAGGGGSRDKVKFALAGDIPIDVTWIDVTEFSAFLDEGVLIDLQPHFDAAAAREAGTQAARPFNEADYFPEILDGMRGPNGHLYGLPSTFTPYVMYVNRTLLEREGLAMPADDWTWQQMESMARAVTRDLDGDGAPDQFGLSLTQWLQAVSPWIWQNGGRLVDEDRRVALGEEGAVGAIAFLQRLLHEDRIASDDATFANQLSVGLFQSGKVAFYGPVGFWETYRFREITDFEWDYHPLPRGKEAATAVAMRFYCVPRTSRHPELAAAYVRKLAGPTMQRGLAAIGNGVPGLIEVARDSVFVDPDTPQREEVFLEVLDGARFLPVDVNWAEVQDISGAVLEDAILLNRLSAEEAGKKASELANASIDRQRAVLSKPKVPRGWFLMLQLSVAIAFGAMLLARVLAQRRARRAAAAREANTPHTLATQEERSAWIFLTPWALGFIFLLAGPAAVSLLLSLTEWSPVQSLGEARWMGLGQYQRLAADETFHKSLSVTARYAFIAVPLQLLVSLGLALLLDRSFRGVGVARTLFYLPTIVSPVILGAMWRWILDGDQGLLNRGLGSLGISGPDWLKDPSWVVPSFILMSLWTVGAQMLVFLAGLQGLDRRQLEAAQLDGAGAWARLRFVILPALGPVLLFNLITGLIAAFQLFAQPFVMTQGGPGNESRFLVLYLYDQGFRFLRMGYASTLAWVLFAVTAVLALVVLRGSRRWVHYAGGAR